MTPLHLPPLTAQWRQVSQAAKELIQGCLQSDPQQRLTIEGVLNRYRTSLTPATGPYLLYPLLNSFPCSASGCPKTLMCLPHPS